MTLDTAEQAALDKQNAGTFSLATILGEENDQLEHPDFKDKPQGGWDEEVKDTEAAQGYCIECEGAFAETKYFMRLVQPTEWKCVPSRSACTTALRGVCG